MRRRRQVTPAERELWAHAVRGAAPLPGRAAATPEPDDAPAPAPRLPTLPDPPPKPKGLRRIDRREAHRLRRGEAMIEARLDLHGLTESEAHHAVDRFVEASWSMGRRLVLLITGKGGVLRTELPRWLAESRHRGRVLALGAAAPRHGGDGAYYLRLRRSRR
jgi:DNA-nicking Smr family endonuclease